MHDVDTRPATDRADLDAAKAAVELTEADLECVVGGLARPWTEDDTDQWLSESALV
jgi:hypothetical protein